MNTILLVFIIIILIVIGYRIEKLTEAVSNDKRLADATKKLDESNKRLEEALTKISKP